MGRRSTRVMPRVWVPVTSMTTYAGWIVNNSGCVTASTAHVVYRRAHEPFLVQTHVGAAEERQQIGQDRGQWCADSANGSDACGARQQLVSEVEAAHRERAAALEHDGRRLGIAQDIELSGRSAVAEEVPPPISEMPATRFARSGADLSASEMFVSGPVGTSQMPSLARTVSTMNSTAFVPATAQPGTLGSSPSIPLSPWMYSAWRTGGHQRLGSPPSARAFVNRAVVSSTRSVGSSCGRGGALPFDRGDAQQLGVSPREQQWRSHRRGQGHSRG